MATNFLCSIPDCGKPVRSMACGMCNAHYKRMKRLGSPTAGGAMRNKAPSECTVDGCTKRPFSLGYCAAHWGRLKRHGDPEGSFRRVARLCAIPSCGRPHVARGYCKSHYNRFMTYGDPLAGPTPIGAVQSWLHEHKTFDRDECLDWPFAKHPEGYAQARDVELGRGVHAHRIMCTLAHGPCPDDKDEVAHSCGNGNLGCINPKHLRWATRSENCNDRTIHGTQNRGERCGMAKLNRDQVREIRSLQGTENVSVLARRYSVSSTTIYSIFARRLWGWLP